MPCALELVAHSATFDWEPTGLVPHLHLLLGRQVLLLLGGGGSPRGSLSLLQHRLERGTDAPLPARARALVVSGLALSSLSLSLSLFRPPLSFFRQGQRALAPPPTVEGDTAKSEIGTLHCP